MGRARSWADEDLVREVKAHKSIANVLRALGLRPSGGNYRAFAHHVARLGVDTSHFQGKKGRRAPPSTGRPLSEILVENSDYTNTGYLKRRLVRAKMLRYACAECNRWKWRGQRLSLHLDHINGITTDNRLENLRLLCPNCHSLTTTYCRPKSTAPRPAPRHPPKSVQKSKCLDCGEAIYYRSKRCKPCAGLARAPTVIDWPPVDLLTQMVEETSYREVARRLGVSDNAVRKRIRRHSARAT
jgi:hypothetical protein